MIRQGISTNKVLFSDAIDNSASLKCDLPQNLHASVSAVIPRSAIFASDVNITGIAVEAVWSQAGHIDGSPSKVMQHGSSVKTLESVIHALHNTAKTTPSTSQQIGKGAQAASNQPNEVSSDAVMLNGESQNSASLQLTSESNDVNSCSYNQSASVSVSVAGVSAQTATPDIPSGDSSSDDPYPVFLPNFPAAIVESEPSPPEGTKQEVEAATFSSCCVSPLSQGNGDTGNAFGASPSTPDSWMLERKSEEATASSTATCVPSEPAVHSRSPLPEDLDSTTSNETQKGHLTADYTEEEPAVQENTAASSSGNGAFFDFLLTQGSEFNPTMKYQIVELIKSEFGKKMTAFNTEISQTETEKRNLEVAIKNFKLSLQQKEEEKLRLFAEIDCLQKNIVQATEKHKTLSHQCVKLRKESEAVKRKISSCDEVEKELFGSPAKTKKLLDR